MIPSRKPINYPPREALVFAEMKIVSLSGKLNQGKMVISAVLQNFNETKGDLDPKRNSFRILIKDLDVASQASKRVSDLVDELNAVATLVYDVQFIQNEIDAERTAASEAEREPDIAQLLIDLKAAEDALNADPVIVR